MKKYLRYTIVWVCFTSLSACNEFLEVKPNQSQVVLSDKLQYLNLVLDDTFTMTIAYPAAGEIAADNILIPDSRVTALLQSQPTSANAYLWEKGLFNELERNDWSACYKVIFNANLVHDNLELIPKIAANKTQWEQLKGSASFFRAFAMFHLLQEFGQPYRQASAATDLGVVIRQTAAIDEDLKRYSNADCYAQVLADLEIAENYLSTTSSYLSQPTKTAAQALLAKTHLVMGKYELALAEAKKALLTKNTLMDFKQLNKTAAYPVPMYNQEVIFHAIMVGLSAFSATNNRVEPTFYNSYASNDNRKAIFYSSNSTGVSYKGSYNGSNSRFIGLATDEQYLIVAECEARLDQKDLALEALNMLSAKRYDASFVPFTASDATTALQLILKERRKELAFRNIRWSDLKRLNAEGLYPETLERTVNGVLKTLLPNASFYALPIPQNALDGTKIKQND